MSTTETLTIRLTGDNKAALASMKETVLALQGVQDATIKMSGKISAGSTSAGFALQNLGRVAQDVPFGFIGIQNNINPLLESFQRLKAETGSTGGALKALAGSLGGAGGLGLAVSIITSAFTFASIGLQAWGVHASKAKKETDDFGKSINDAAASAVKDGLTLQAYVKIAKDHSNSLAERNHALQEANKLYGEHSEKLTLVNIQTDKVTDAINGYTEALIRNAVAAKYGDQLADSFVKQRNAANSLKTELFLLDKFNKRGTSGGLNVTSIADNAATSTEGLRLQKAVATATKVSAEAQKEYNDKLSFFNGIMADLNEEETKFGKHEKDKKEKLSELQRILKTLAEELKGIDGLENAGIRGFEDSKIDRVKAYTKAIEDLAKIGLTNVNDKFKELLATRDAFFKSSGNTPFQKGNSPFITPGSGFNNDLGQTTPSTIGTGQNRANQAIANAAALNKEKQAQDFLNKALKDTQAIMSILGPEIDHVFDALLKGESIGQVLGNVFKDLAIQIAKAAIKALIFQAILATFTGGASSIGGVGKADGFFGSFKKLLGFASGGVVTGPKSGYPIMAHGTEAILNGGQLKNLVNNVAGSARMNTVGMGSNGMDALADQIAGLKSSIASVGNNQPRFQVLPFMKGADMNIIISSVQRQTQRNY